MIDLTGLGIGGTTKSGTYYRQIITSQMPDIKVGDKVKSVTNVGAIRRRDGYSAPKTITHIYVVDSFGEKFVQMGDHKHYNQEVVRVYMTLVETQEVTA